MKTNHTRQYFIRLIRLFGITTVFGVLFFGANTVMAQSCGPANCAGATGSGKTCTVIANLNCGAGMTTNSSTTVINSMNANCDYYGVQSGVAMHTVGQLPSASCNFSFMKGSSSVFSIPMPPYSTSVPTTTFFSTSTMCSISTIVDGLPVELMGFEIGE